LYEIFGSLSTANILFPCHLFLTILECQKKRGVYIQSEDAIIKGIERDPISKAIYGGIKRGILVAIENNCLASAVILILSGMDTMAALGMPKEQLDVTRDDFVKWAERYIKFPCEDQLTGLDLYGARCAMLHCFGVVSKLSRTGQCRMVGYMDDNDPEVKYSPEVDKDLVLVSVAGLAEAFFNGVDQFLVDVFADKKRAEVAEERLSWLMQEYPRKV
jgi:hypothetical protein